MNLLDILNEIHVSWFNEKTPDVAKTFAEMRNAVCKEGALEVRTKELISIAASVLMMGIKTAFDEAGIEIRKMVDDFGYLILKILKLRFAKRKLTNKNRR